jgi:hypothetical protein
MAHALPKTTKRGDCSCRLGNVKWDNFAVELLNSRVAAPNIATSADVSNDHSALAFAQRGRPNSSYPRISSAGLGSRTGNAASFRVMASIFFQSIGRGVSCTSAVPPWGQQPITNNQ